LDKVGLNANFFEALEKEQPGIIFTDFARHPTAVP
jgi:hypothetical protein